MGEDSTTETTSFEPQPSTSTDYFEPEEASEEASAIVTDTEPIVSQPVIMHYCLKERFIERTVFLVACIRY